MDYNAALSNFVSFFKSVHLKKILFLLLLSIFFVHLLFRIISYTPRYTENLSGEYWKKQYLASQWVVPNSQNSIGDDGLYAYHGWELINGGDPSNINPEVPPLGKYAIGIFVKFFQNNNLFGLFSVLFLLFSFFLLNKVLFKNSLHAFLPIFAFSFSPLFYEQLQASFLEAFHLALLMLTIFFFLRKQYMLSAIFLGCFAAVKFSYLAPLVMASEIVYLILQNKKEDILKVLVSYSLVIGVLLLSYLSFFINGNSLLDFLKLQKFILNFYSEGAKPPFAGMIFPMIFFGDWYTWWGMGVQKVSEWSLLWPISFILAGSAVLYKKTFTTSKFLILFLWCIFYLFFLVITPVWPRYLLLLLPFLYNLGIWVLLKNTLLKSFFARQ